MADGNHHGMAQRPQVARTRKARQFRPLYIGQWIRALGQTPADVMRTTGINEGYLSQLIAGKKKNPSGNKLAAIAEFLGIPMDYLYRMPPDKDFVAQATAFEPGVLSRLHTKH